MSRDEESLASCEVLLLFFAYWWFAPIYKSLGKKEKENYHEKEILE